MNKWQYLAIRCGMANIESRLNDLGRHGWELVAVFPIGSETTRDAFAWQAMQSITDFVAIFKRPIDIGDESTPSDEDVKAWLSAGQNWKVLELFLAQGLSKDLAEARILQLLEEQ